MYNPAQAFIHIAKSLKTYRTSQNLSKSMSAPTLKNEKKIKHENTTMCIVHSTLRVATTPYTERCTTKNSGKKQLFSSLIQDTV
jgi:hypothetical protein